MIRPGAASGVIALLLGCVFAFAFPPYSWAVTGFLALVGFAMCVHRAPSGKAAFWTGYAFGVGQFILNFFWIANAFAVREGFSYPQGVAAVIALALVMALYPASASYGTYRFVKFGGGTAGFVPAFVLCWLVTEYLRGVLFTGFPWNPVGAMWGEMVVMAQGARLVGVYGLGAITVGIAALFASALLQRRPGCALAGIAALGAQVIYGLWIVPSGPQPVHDAIELVLVQANIPQQDKWNRALLQSHLRKHIQLSQAHSKDTESHRVIIWPETAYPYLLEGEAAAQARLQTQVGKEASLIIGANRFVEQQGRKTARNSLFVLQDGGLKARYDKTHLVPFGEYVPLAPLLETIGVKALVEAFSGFSKGPGPRSLQVADLASFAPMICYEGIFPRHMFGVEGRPEWILNISNDAWFGHSSGPSQHLNLVRFRAIEQGLSVVRSTGTGITAVIDPFGRLTSSLAPFQTGTLVAKLPKSDEGGTLFSTLGRMVVPLACILALSVYTLCINLFKN